MLCEWCACGNRTLKYANTLNVSGCRTKSIKSRRPLLPFFSNHAFIANRSKISQIQPSAIANSKTSTIITSPPTLYFTPFHIPHQSLVQPFCHQLYPSPPHKLPRPALANGSPPAKNPLPPTQKKKKCRTQQECPRPTSRRPSSSQPTPPPLTSRMRSS